MLNLGYKRLLINDTRVARNRLLVGVFGFILGLNVYNVKGDVVFVLAALLYASVGLVILSVAQFGYIIVVRFVFRKAMLDPVTHRPTSIMSKTAFWLMLLGVLTVPYLKGVGFNKDTLTITWFGTVSLATSLLLSLIALAQRKISGESIWYIITIIAISTLATIPLITLLISW